MLFYGKQTHNNEPGILHDETISLPIESNSGERPAHTLSLYPTT